MSGHGFRVIARTMLDEVLNFPPHLIEHQLAHVPYVIFLAVLTSARLIYLNGRR